MNIRAETTTYRARDGVNISTYVARPDGPGPYPALILGYEFWDARGARRARRTCVNAPPGLRKMAALPRSPITTVVNSPRWRAAPSLDRRATNRARATSVTPSTGSKACPTSTGSGSASLAGAEVAGQAWFLAANCSKLKAAASFYGRPINRPTMHGPLADRSHPADELRLVRRLRRGRCGDRGGGSREVPRRRWPLKEKDV